MSQVSGFEKIAPFLNHPLVLIGFVVLIFFGLFRALLKAKIIPSLPKTTGGEVVKIFLKYGFIIAVLIILLGFAIEGYKLYLSSKQNENDRRVISELQRLQNPIKDVKLDFWLPISLDHPELAGYRKRLEQGIDSLLSSRGKNFDSFNRPGDNSVYASVGRSDGTIEKIEIMPWSSLFPNAGTEKFAYSVLTGQAIDLFFYKNPISITEFPYRKTDAPESTLKAADLKMSFYTSPGENAKISMQYDVLSRQITLRGFRVSTDASYWEKNNKIVSIPDLVNAEMFVRVFQLVGLSLDEKEKRVHAKVETLVLTIGDGQEFWVRNNNLKAYDETESTIYSFRFPDNMEKLVAFIDKKGR